jgi:hypothetical protein
MEDDGPGLEEPCLHVVAGQHAKACVLHQVRPA